MTQIGYARVSTADQDTALQVDALVAAGCARRDIYTDTASGKLAARPGLEKALKRLQAGDTLAVWKLDRLGRSVRHLVEVVGQLHEREVGFRSLTEGIDTTTNGGRLVFHIFAAIAEFERGLIVERTRAGLAVAHANGKRSGRKPRLTPLQVNHARRLRDEGTSVVVIAQTLGVSRPVIYRALEGWPSEAS